MFMFVGDPDGLRLRLRIDGKKEEDGEDEKLHWLLLTVETTSLIGCNGCDDAGCSECRMRCVRGRREEMEARGNGISLRIRRVDGFAGRAGTFAARRARRTTARRAGPWPCWQCWSRGRSGLIRRRHQRAGRGSALRAPRWTQRWPGTAFLSGPTWGRWMQSRSAFPRSSPVPPVTLLEDGRGLHSELRCGGGRLAKCL